MTQPLTSIPFDRSDQLQQIQSGLMDGEQILAVYDAIGVAPDSSAPPTVV